jgi:hypothetical protein
MPARLFYDAVQYKTTAESEPVRLAGAAAPAPSPATNIRQEGSPPNPATARAETTATLPLEAIAPVEPAPVDGLKISSQFWRRGGLGSRALVTFTLRDFLRLCPPGRKPFDRPHADDPRHPQHEEPQNLCPPACMSALSTLTPTEPSARRLPSAGCNGGYRSGAVTTRGNIVVI